jgi:hypothetical protein
VDRARRLDFALDEEPDLTRLADLVAHGCADEIEEMPLDPVPREVVRDGEHEGLVRQLSARDVAEPCTESRLVERSFEAS